MPKLASLCRLLTALLTVAWPGVINAQDAPREEFSVNRFAPAAGSGNYLMVDGGAVGGNMGIAAGLLVDYAHRPFVLFTATCTDNDTDDCELEEAEKAIVSYQVTSNVMASITFANAVQIGLVLPVVGTGGEGYHASRGEFGAAPVRILGGDAFVLGDPRLSAKFRLVADANGFNLAGVIYGTAPVGKEMAEGFLVGHDGPTGGGHLAAELRRSRFRIAANVGGTYRAERALLSTESGPELTYGAGAALELTPLLAIGAEITGASRFSDQLDENPMEGRVYAQLSQSDLVFTLGGGVGMLGGIGIPNFRVIGGASYAPTGVDSDDDGVPDKHDKCPAEREDFDGYLDDDGCPESDNDADGLPDTVDRCPDEPEDNDGKEDSDGCPERDNDGDGIEDGYDSCPDQPEDKDGDRDEDGCPDDDRDRDGVPDDTDQCPNEPEDTDGFGDEDGCPEADFDGDGLPDEEDQCPDEVEDIDQFEDDDGCPEEEGPPVNVRSRVRG